MESIQGAKYLWRLPLVDKKVVNELVLAYNLSFPVVQTLVNRGYATKADLEAFLFTSRELVVGDPELLLDAQKAVDRILLAIKNKEKILIAGDYDVDGMTSSALMMTCLLDLGAQVNFFLPHRVRDGYGLSASIVKRSADNNYKVIITVDNGITAFEAADEARKYGVDLIITDHHRQHDTLPDAFAIVNPNRKDCVYPYKQLAGVGVAFKVISLLYKQLGKELPEIVYELLLLGTIADVVPLTGENRFWVRYGLQKVNAFETHALRVLKQNARFAKPQLTALDIGFGLTPQLNALGRLEDPRAGVKFLVGADSSETERVGKVLHELNQARKTVERKIIDDVEQQISDGLIDPEKDLVIIASSASWPPGVIGLAASRFVSKYGRPVLLFHETKAGLLKGSGRSIPEFNLFEALADAQVLLKQFGGHTVAAGLSLVKENLPKLKECLEKRIKATLTAEDLQQKIMLDAELNLRDTNQKLVADLGYLEPFGCGNSKPYFFIKNVSLLEDPVLLKDLHVKCTVFAEGVIKPVIFFNRPELYDILMQHGKESFDIAVQVTENHWQGRANIEFFGIDIAGIGLSEGQ
jgi:single-stranded-DNA-specific exonuclease